MGKEQADTTPHSPLRKKMQAALGKNAKYTRLKPDRKAPTRSFKEGKPNRMKQIPRTGNYGVIPEGRLMVLDFDDHRDNSWEIDEQIDFFSELLDVNLRNSLSVITQSGGVHVYLMLPESIEEKDIQTLPKASLRGYNKAFSELLNKEVRLDADIRTSAVNAYVVGPTSSISFPDKKTKYKGYLLANESFGFKNLNFEILTISESGFSKLQAVASKREAYIKQDLLERLSALPEWAEETTDKNLIHGKPDFTVMAKLRKKITTDDVKVYHRARAFVKASLHCCYDDYSIALACSMLEIDKDSYRGDSISFQHLMRDIKRFKPSVRYHGSYCRKGKEQAAKHRPKASQSEDFNLEEFVKNKKEWIKKKRESEPSGMVSPKVIDIGKVSETLIGSSRKKKPSQQYFDAMAIINYYVQPLSNAGALRMLLAHSDISNSLNISPSRVRQAMRVLREREILQIASKQRTGMAASYVISETFHHNFLTKSLKLTWGKFNSNKDDNRIDRSIYFDAIDGTYKTVFGDEIVEPISDFSSWVEKMTQDLPIMERYGAGAATRYLRYESQALEEITELDKDYKESESLKEQESILNEKPQPYSSAEENTILKDTENKELEDLVNLDDLTFSERYEVWDDSTVLDLVSGELKQMNDLSPTDSS